MPLLAAVDIDVALDDRYFGTLYDATKHHADEVPRMVCTHGRGVLSLRTFDTTVLNRCPRTSS